MPEPDFGGIHPPAREIDIARGCVDQILSLEDLDVVETVYVIDLLRRAADWMAESLSDYALRTTLMDEVEALRGQNDLLRSLIKAEDGEIDMDELNGA